MKASFRALPEQHITDFSFLSLNDHLSKMPERKDKRCKMPWKSGRKRGKAFCTGEVFSLVIPYHWRFSYIKAAMLVCSGGSWKLNPSPAFAGSQLRKARKRKGQLSAAQVPNHQSSEWWDGCHLQMGRVQPLSAPLIQPCTHLCFTLTTSVWELVTGTLSARCWGTGKPGRMRLFEVVTQTLIKHPGLAFIPPLDLCLQLLDCLCFFQTCYFIVMPPGLNRRAIISCIV